MGAKTWMLVYASASPKDALRVAAAPDRAGSLSLARRLFPGERLEEIGDGDLSLTCPPDDEIHVGCFKGASVVAAKEFGIDFPSQLSDHFIRAGGSEAVYLRAMHSVVDWFAFACWRGGKLRRALSLSPDSGVLEDIGDRLPFERAYWSGEHPAIDPEDEDEENPYPFQFHPLELGEAALAEFFGYQLEGFSDSTLLDPERVTLVRYRRSKPRWKFWQ